MRIKKFNELFDSEEIKSSHELDILQGKDILKDVINLPINFTNEGISGLISKITKFNYPFIGVFLEKPDGMKFSNCETRLAQSQDEDFWVFITEAGDSVVTLGIRINKTNDYDVFIYSEDGTEGSEDGLHYDHTSYSQLMEIIKDAYIPMLISYDFGDILTYGEDTSEVNN